MGGYRDHRGVTVAGAWAWDEEFGFGELGLHRIFATCDPRNIGSRRVLEKAGMQCEGILREHKWQKGEWRDSCLYAMLEHEWRE